MIEHGEGNGQELSTHTSCFAPQNTSHYTGHAGCFVMKEAGLVSSREGGRKVEGGKCN